ncbi:DUF6338 family protein [Streptomyces alboflavus]|uniref:DUF6338 family protein n=1 Tax=Streptomyces alboflavus TaxID=67267 RepID=UPI0036B14F35
MPSGLVSLVVMLLAGTPGYLYLFCYERRTRRDALSPGREIAELFAVGASSTLAAALAVLSLAEVWSALLPLDELVAGRAGLLRDPWKTLATGALTLTASAALCAGLGHVLGGRSGYADRHRFRHGTVWHGVLTAPCHRRRPGQPPVRTRRFVAVHLIDGLKVEGYFESVSLEVDTAWRDISLAHPIALTPPGGTRRRSTAASVIIPGALVRLIESGPPPLPDRRLRGGPGP